MLDCKCSYCYYTCTMSCDKQVDEEIFTVLSTRKWTVATKFSLTCSNEETFMRAMEKLVQVRTAKQYRYIYWFCGNKNYCYNSVG